MKWIKIEKYLVEFNLMYYIFGYWAQNFQNIFLLIDIDQH